MKHVNTDPARRSDAGFTLIEALIATMVLMFGIVPIANLMVVAASSNTVGNQSTGATAIAAQQMEMLKAQHFACQAVGQATCIPTLPPLQVGGDVANDVPNYNRTDDILGVGRIHTRWSIVQPNANTFFIRVRSEGQGALVRQRSRAEFTTFRTCTVQGCP